MLGATIAVLLGLPATLAQNFTCVRFQAFIIFLETTKTIFSVKPSKMLVLPMFCTRIPPTMPIALHHIGLSVLSLHRTASFSQHAHPMS
jgi:hypothetical protein